MCEFTSVINSMENNNTNCLHSVPGPFLSHCFGSTVPLPIGNCRRMRHRHSSDSDVVVVSKHVLLCKQEWRFGCIGAFLFIYLQRFTKLKTFCIL